MLNFYLRQWGQAHRLTPTFIIEPEKTEFGRGEFTDGGGYTKSYVYWANSTKTGGKIGANWKKFENAKNGKKWG